MQVLSRDTFVASLLQQGNNVVGKLNFNNYEKDKSSGPASGKLEGNIVKLMYSFNAEGITSVMEVYYKYENEKLVRGTGDMKTKGDTVYYSNPSAIKYEGGGLSKISCDILPSKYTE